MTVATIGSLTAPQQNSDAASVPTEQQRKAAQEFEAIFLRQLLSSLEKSSGLAGSSSSGGAVFRSMMVSALADAAASGGGIGLRDQILKAMLPPAPPARPELPQPEAVGAGAAPELGAQAAVFRDGMGGAAPEEGARAAADVPLGSLRLGAAGRGLTRARSLPPRPGVAIGDEAVSGLSRRNR